MRVTERGGRGREREREARYDCWNDQRENIYIYILRNVKQKGEMGEVWNGQKTKLFET